MFSMLFFPSFCKGILTKLFFFRLKFKMVDPVSLPPFSLRGDETMQHLVIDNVGEKIRGKMGVIEKAVDPDDSRFKMVGAECPPPLGLSIGISLPCDRKIEPMAEII